MLKLVRAVANLSISNLSTSAFELAKSTFLENAYVSARAAFFTPDFVRKIKFKFYNFVLPPS